MSKITFRDFNFNQNINDFVDLHSDKCRENNFFNNKIREKDKEYLRFFNAKFMYGVLHMNICNIKKLLKNEYYGEDHFHRLQFNIVTYIFTIINGNTNYKQSLGTQFEFLGEMNIEEAFKKYIWFQYPLTKQMRTVCIVDRKTQVVTPIFIDANHQMYLDCGFPNDPEGYEGSFSWDISK